MKKSTFWLALLLSGCASVRGPSYAVGPLQTSPSGVSIQGFEVRMSSLGTVDGVVVYDAQKRPVGVVGGAGTSEVEAATSLAGPIAIGVSGALIGDGLGKVSLGLPAGLKP